MSRTTSIFSVSLPLEMLAKLERVRVRERRTRSKLIREVLRRYFSREVGSRTAAPDCPHNAACGTPVAQVMKQDKIEV
ncbi:ribbon-helix-helix protein, CopG family [Bradyrhizobium sp. CCGB20]|uniref:ribbon-helix-helix protein, CopG family n=1 Tax=unclassified Bradyrhizobium TaxID=2631580 RepID=UPI0035C6BA84